VPEAAVCGDGDGNTTCRTASTPDPVPEIDMPSDPEHRVHARRGLAEALRTLKVDATGPVRRRQVR
jgi:hypothetical protein